MAKKYWFYIWGGLFILCALLGFIPEPKGLLKILLIMAAVAFFIPGGVLLYRGYKALDLATLQAVCTISLTSLGSTLFFLVLNFLSANAGKAAGDLLYGFLVIFSAPMVCSQFWVISLFLWACLLMTGISLIKKAKKKLSQR